MSDRPPPEHAVFAALTAYGRLVWGRRIVVARLQLDDGREVVLPVDPVEAPAPAPARPAGGPVHSPDFRSVNWFGEVYSFTETQAAVVRVLWEAWERGTPDIGDRVLRNASGGNADRLADIFRDSPTWGTLIVEGRTRGTHRLADPGE